MGSGDKRLEYDQVRGYVLNLAQQRANSMTPKPSEVMGINQGDEEIVEPDKFTAEEWMAWVGAISNPVQCW
eukprot:11892729-Karenia_brevis.AAC.1